MSMEEDHASLHLGQQIFAEPPYQGVDEMKAQAAAEAELQGDRMSTSSDSSMKDVQQVLSAQHTQLAPGETAKLPKLFDDKM